MAEQSWSEIGAPYKIASVNVSELEFLEKNARYMPNEMYRNLVENIRRDGGLSSVPFCWKHGDKYRILSGNHRVSAAIDAGLERIPVMYTDAELTSAEQTAIALSHNALEGKDDLSILKELWSELDDVDLKSYAGLDDKTLKEMEKASLQALKDFGLEYRSVTFLFLPEEEARLEEATRQAVEQGGLSETIYVNRLADFERMLKASAKVKSAYDVKNNATVMMLMLDIFNRHLEDLQAGYLDGEELKHKNKVPMSSVLGSENISAESALLLKKAVTKMISRGELNKRDKSECIRLMAEQYLKAGK